MNINNFQKYCGILEAQVGNIETWVWPTQDTQTFGIIVNDWFNNIRPILKELSLDKKGTVIQAGGNCGVYPLLYTEFFDNICTFEPDPLSFYCLVNNCQFPNIHKFNCALGDQPGNVVMEEVNSVNRGMNKTKPTNEIGIPLVAIDSFDFTEVKLIQLDLEGYEIFALKGAVNTINKYKPPLIIECAEDYQEIYDFIQPLGYKNKKQISRLDMLFTTNA